MLKSIFGSGGNGASKVAVPLPTPMQLRYQLFRNRWHLDSRDPLSFVVLHDVFTAGQSLSPYVAGITRIPVRGVSPIVPLDVYVPDLRCHGLSPAATDVSILAQASDVLEFIRGAVEFKESVHIVGFGHGARVALAAGLVAPTQITTITAIDAAMDEERTKNIREALKQLPPVEGTTLASMNDALSRLMPTERDRLGVMLNYYESNVKSAPPQWRSAPWLQSLASDEAIKSLHTWPTSALQTKVFAGKTRFVKYQQGKPVSQLPEGLARAQFPHATEVTFADSLPADQVFQSILGQLELIDDVSHVVQAATSC